MTDVRYALRQWRAAPGFAAVVIASLALGIGAATAIFSAVRPVLFNALPYPDPERLTKVIYAGENGVQMAQTFGTFRELQARTRAFEWLAVFKTWQPTIIGPPGPARIDGQRVTADYFRTLGIAPALGSDFSAIEDRPRGSDVVILSDALWRTRLAGDPGIVGRQITIDDRLFTVIGVMPARFHDVLAPSAAAWTLLQYDPSLPPQGPEWGHHLQMIAKLRRKSTLDDARRETEAIARHRVPEFLRPPHAAMTRGVVVAPLHEDVTREVRPAVLAVAAAVVLLLAIACVNVATLLAARGARRRSEFAMRIALGAGRRRLFRQMLTESVLLASAGGVLGVVFAASALRLVAAIAPATSAFPDTLTIGRGVLAFAAGTTALVAMLVGLAPSLAAHRDDVRDGLQFGSRLATGAHNRVRRVLVAAEVALSVVLLVGAGLLARSLDRLLALPVGFDPARLETMQVQVATLKRLATPAAVNRFFDDALEAVRAMPAVLDAAFTSQLPLSGDELFEVYGVEFERPDAGRTDRMPAYRYAVTPGYFQTMAIPLRRGRLFSAHDRGRQPSAVVVSESFARRIFGDADPVGQRVRFGGPADRPWDTIVGVVGDVKQASLAATEANAVYVDAADWLWADNPRWLVVRAKGDAPRIVPEIRRAIWSVDRDQPIVRAGTMDALIAASEQKRRYVLFAFESFAAAALALAAIAIYGLLAGTVAERTREIGVRTALGASSRAVAFMIVRQCMTVTAIGVVCGLGGAAAATRILGALLFGISPLDPVAYAGGTVILFAAATLACWIPAYRAAAIEPAVTLRAE